MFSLEFALIPLQCRLEELRHRLIPLYSYDPAEEQEEWGDADREDEETELTVSEALPTVFKDDFKHRLRGTVLIVIRLVTDKQKAELVSPLTFKSNKTVTS